MLCFFSMLLWLMILLRKVGFIDNLIALSFFFYFLLFWHTAVVYETRKKQQTGLQAWQVYMEAMSVYMLIDHIISLFLPVWNVEKVKNQNGGFSTKKRKWGIFQSLLYYRSFLVHHYCRP